MKVTVHNIATSSLYIVGRTARVAMSWKRKRLLRSKILHLVHPGDRAVDHLALRTIAEACGNLETITGDAGIDKKSLYRALSKEADSSLKTFLAALKAAGLRISVEAGRHLAASS